MISYISLIIYIEILAVDISVGPRLSAEDTLQLTLAGGREETIETGFAEQQMAAALVQHLGRALVTYFAGCLGAQA